MKRIHQPRSTCPISFALEAVGDAWSLLILRDMVYFGKKTYGEFFQSDEGIARNILANRLKNLTESGIITKHLCESDKRKDIYKLTEKGLELIPILLDAAQWGAKNGEETDAPEQWLSKVRKDREHVISVIENTVRQGGSIFMGENTVLKKLKISL